MNAAWFKWLASCVANTVWLGLFLDYLFNSLSKYDTNLFTFQHLITSAHIWCRPKGSDICCLICIIHLGCGACCMQLIVQLVFVCDFIITFITISLLFQFKTCASIPRVFLWVDVSLQGETSCGSSAGFTTVWGIKSGSWLVLDCSY